MTLPSDPHGLLALSATLLSIGIFVRSLEVVVRWGDLRDGQLLGWRRSASAKRTLRGVLQGYPVCGLVMLWRTGASGACCLLPYDHVITGWLLGSLLIAQLYYNHRFDVIFSSSDHVNLVGLSAVFLGSIPGASFRLQAACLGFMGFQALLAYAATGIDKLRRSHWRDGSRLVQILRESAFQFSPLGEFLARHAGVATLATWAVILLELLFPLSLFLPTPGFWVFIAAGLLFHGVNAFTMGVHGFFWAFIGTYPALYFLHSLLSDR